jgi:hypothetical protein
MELFSILIFIGFIVGIIWLYFKAIITLNASCEEKYGYRPITYGKCFIASLPIILIILGALMDDGKSDGLNLYVASIIGLIIIGWLWFRILSNTSLAESLGAMTLLVITETIFFLVIFLAIILYIESKRNKKVYIKID